MIDSKKPITILGPEKGYVEMLDEATLEAFKKEAAGPRKYYPLRPSSAGKCTRELAYELAEYHGFGKYGVEERKPSVSRLLNLGHHIERHLIQEFERHLAPQGYELKYKQQTVTFFPVTFTKHPEWNRLVEGSLDSCFFSPETRGVVDYKSKGDKFSAYFESKWTETADKLSRMKSVEMVSDIFFKVYDLPAFLEELKDPFFEMNFVQLNGYANSDFLKARGVDHCSILQSNKNDSRLREIRFKPSAEVFEKTRLRFQAAADAVDLGNPELAPRDYVLGSLKCRFCPFAGQCWDGKDVKKAFYNTLPPKQWPKDTGRLGSAGQELEQLFDTYLDMSAMADEAKDLESKILKLMMDRNLTRIRLESGEIYMAKRLKDSVVLRRTKL